jgi:hypothetical protein
MSSLLIGSLGPAFAFAGSLLAAWKAAGLLQADNRMLAVLAGLTFAFVGPHLIGDMIAALAVNAKAPLEPSKEMYGLIPQLASAGFRVGFALVGVLAWCGIESVRQAE